MSKSHITKEQARHIAELVNLEITGQEEKFMRMLSETLDYIEILDELDTKDVDETYQVTGLTNVYQEGDLQDATLSQKDAMSNASEKAGNLFVTEGVFDR